MDNPKQDNATSGQDAGLRINVYFIPLPDPINVSGTLQSWNSQVARARNRIVHRGYRPRPSEAADALNAVNQLVNWVGDLLAAKAAQFPRTASMMVTPDRMRRQNVPERVITNIDRLARTEPPWRDNYSAWRDRVDAAVVRRGQA
jgi:hypothetical protein